MKKFSLLLIIVGLLILSNVSVAQLVVDPPIAWQGKVVKVKLVSAEGITRVSGSFLGKNFKYFKTGDDFKGVVGVPINQKTGQYNLQLIVTRDDGSTEKIVKKIKVWATKFPFTKFWLKPARNKLRAKQIIDDEWGQIDKVLRVEASQQLWGGKFSWPAEGRISQGFGHRQIINGKRSGNHRGVDVAVITGTKIKAPNHGKVVFAKRLKAFGGTIVLDHGQGIHTLYFHLSKLISPVGEAVEKGDIIGLSGNSGISSGAHLHWGMSVHNLRVDPMQWMKYDI
ncbi:MAG: M23 family metallopeptidase [Candidatus Margulisiibacteriota bacterium]